MFKRLRERIAEEATKLPVQLNNNAGKQGGTESKIASANSSEDLITLSDSSSVVIPHTSSQQFSIGEDEDASISEQNTPQKQTGAANGSVSEQAAQNAGVREQRSTTGSDHSFGLQYQPTKSNYVPQSDIESEREDPPTMNLEGISKDQLLSAIEILKARVHKYKNKYTEVVKNYRQLHDEKVKIENTLMDQQDKGLRRIGELREQCQLEQKAKAHLEANLRLMLEEKDSRISVLQTQVNLLKQGEKGDGANIFPDNLSISSDASGDNKSDNSTLSQESCVQPDKLERLEHQLNQAKKTITSQTDQLTLLRKQNEGLSKELEEKVKKLNEMEDEQSRLRSEHEETLRSLRARLEELETQQEESCMSMAETKRDMHEELEFKEKQLLKAKEEAKQHQSAYEAEKAKAAEVQKLCDEKINELQRQKDAIEKLLEEEKQNLMQELNRGKSAAITLMQQDCAKKISSVEEEYKAKLEEMEKNAKKDASSEKEISALKGKLDTSEQQISELKSTIKELENNANTLKRSVESKEMVDGEKTSSDSLKFLQEKLESTEKNYSLEISEMKSHIVSLENEMCSLKQEKQELLKAQEKLSDLKNSEKALSSKVKMKEEELKNLLAKYEDQVAEIHSFQESMKDKDNMILKLKTNIETITKENVEKVEELKRKIKVLEEEREQLMIQAQQRISATEAKCREDIRVLQEQMDAAQSENKEISKLYSKIKELEQDVDKYRQKAEAATAEVFQWKDKFSIAEQKVSEVMKLKAVLETDLDRKVQKLEEENASLLGKTNHVESLKAEKEELNEKLKRAEQQLSLIESLESERETLKRENLAIYQELEILKSSQSQNSHLEENLELLKTSEAKLRLELDELKRDKELCQSETTGLNDSLLKEKEGLMQENDRLTKQVELLEGMRSSDPESSSFKEYFALMQVQSQTALKRKEEEMETKLKHLVRDFCVQMDVKDQDCDKMLSELLEKNQDMEERLLSEHRGEIAELKQNLFEKECALDDMRDTYEETLQEKEKQIKELQSSLKKFSDSSQKVEPVVVSFSEIKPALKNDNWNDVEPLAAESSDWDDQWELPNETMEDVSPLQDAAPCNDHLQQIDSLKEELVKCNSEIKELKVLLRLSPPESMIENNNHRRDSLQSIPEPTEFEYLKNIIFEYMMGKEPVTLAKVIAAVLRFSDSQTRQVIRQVETTHSAR